MPRASKHDFKAQVESKALYRSFSPEINAFIES